MDLLTVVASLFLAKEPKSQQYSLNGSAGDHSDALTQLRKLFKKKKLS
jgi:hypothetical protein